MIRTEIVVKGSLGKVTAKIVELIENRFVENFILSFESIGNDGFMQCQQFIVYRLP
jgi:hypothetical protein